MIHDYYLSKASDYTNTELAKELAKEKSKILDSIINDKDYEFFLPNNNDIEKLPANSTLIKIKFTLKKPYTSKADGEFHYYEKDERGRITPDILKNPIVRDKFTGLPLVKPSTWKGHLRYAAGMVDDSKIENKEKIIQRLFGSASVDDDSTKGRLYFYPTFFEDKPKKDVITPLKRATRTPGRSGPIPIEVMDNATGDFHLLYFPYPKGEDYDDKQVDEDLKFLAESLKNMFYTYGFSAKKTSGFGVIKKLKENNVEITPADRKNMFDGLWPENAGSGGSVKYE
jgi:CRISPR-associated protein Cmr2